MPIRIHQVVVTLGLLLVSLDSRLASAQQKSAQEKTESLVTIESGDLPIILSVPHGGLDAIDGLAERRGESPKSEPMNEKD